MRALTLAVEVLLNCSSTENKYSLAVKKLLYASFLGIPPLIADVTMFFIIRRDIRLKRSHLVKLTLSLALLSFVKTMSFSTRKA
jgi:hypothetical protein